MIYDWYSRQQTAVMRTMCCHLSRCHRFLLLGARSNLVEMFSIFVRHFDILKMNISLHDEEKERTNQTINTKHTMTPYQIPYPKQPYTTILINLQPTFNKCSLHSNLRLWRKRGTIMCSTILGEYYISKPLLSVMKTNGDERRHQWPGSWSILSTFGFEFYSSYM